MTIQIRNAMDDFVTRDFLNLPARVYRNDPNYCPRFLDSEKRELYRPEFTGKSIAFVGYRNAVPECRVLARISPALKDETDLPMGILGMYEAFDSPEATLEMLLQALEWYRCNGVRTIIGPMNGDTWHSYRFSCGPWDAPVFLMEPYNPPYYLNHWLSVGFQTYQEYYSKTVEDLESLVERTARFAEKSASRGYTVRHLKMKNFYCELRTLYNLSVKIFNENLLFTPIDYPEFEGLYTGSRALIDPECVLFALDRTGTPAGFLFGFPDEFSAVRSMRGHKHLIARFRFLRRKGRARIMNAKSLGILPDHRGAGLAGMLMHQLYRVALNRGFNRVNLCLFHESNPSGSLEAGLGAISRKYKLLKKTLETTIRE